MRMLIDGHHLDGSKHGIANFLETALTYLDNTSHEVLVAIPSNSKLDETAFKNIKFLRIQSFFVYRFLFGLHFLIVRNKIDVFWGQNFRPIISSKNCKYIVTVQDILPVSHSIYFGFLFRNLFSLLLKFNFKLKTEIVVTTDYCKREILRVYGNYIDQSRVRVIGLPISYLKYVAERDTLLTDNDILYVSRFEKRKNHLNLLRAWDLSGLDCHYRLVLVGFDVDGTFLNVRETIGLLGLKNVVVRSNIDDKTLAKVAASATGIIYPSVIEGFGLPILEGLVLNGNVAFSDTGPSRSWRHFNCAPFSPFKLGEIEIALHKLTTRNIKDKALVQEMATTFVRENHSKEVIMKKYEQIFKGVN